MQVQLCRGNCRFVSTLRTKVLSLSGISRGMVVLTSTMADRGMLTLGFEDYSRHESRHVKAYISYSVRLPGRSSGEYTQLCHCHVVPNRLVMTLTGPSDKLSYTIICRISFFCLGGITKVKLSPSGSKCTTC